MKFDVIDLKNKKVEDLEISSDVIFEEVGLIEKDLVHRLLMLQHTRPSRTASTKTRSEVRGGGAKPWRQKGTGRARAGSLRSPLFAGGGVIFGPKPHKITISMPKRARKKALCSLLSLKVKEIKILNEYPKFTEPKTAKAKELLEDLNITGEKILFILDQHNEADFNLLKSLKNIEKCKVIHWQNLNPHDALNANVIIFDKNLIKNTESWLLTRLERKGICCSCCSCNSN